MNKSDKIYVAGANGLVGSAIVRRLEKGGFENILTSDVSDFDLTDSSATLAFMQRERPDYVIVGEASEMNVKRGQRGRTRIHFDVKGAPAHSAHPTRGINAVYKAADLAYAGKIRRIDPFTVLRCMASSASAASRSAVIASSAFHPCRSRS